MTTRTSTTAPGLTRTSPGTVSASRTRSQAPPPGPAPTTTARSCSTEGASRAVGQSTVGVGGLGSSAVGAGPLNGGAAFASTEERPLYGLWQLMVVDANRRLLRNHFKPIVGDDDTRAAVRAQLFTTGPQSLGYAIDLISIDRAVDVDEEFLGDVALYTTDANGKPDLVDGFHATLILKRTYDYHWELAAPDGMLLEPTTTYALVFLGDDGTYPKLFTISGDGEDAPDEGWRLADALLYRSGTSWVENPDGRSMRIEIIGPRLVDLDPIVSIRSRSIREDIGTAVLTVTLSWPSRVSVSVPWSTSELDAVSPDDYTDGRGVLTFAPGATEATISIPIADDAVPEDVESFAVTLGPGEGYRANPSSNVAFAKILDNDGDELVPSRATVNGTTLLLTYNEILDSASTPSPSHFYVTADDNRVEVDQVSVGGSMVTLTLATAVEAGQTVLLGYVGGGAIQDGEGNAAMSFTDWLVTNITGGGTNPPGRPAAPSVSATAGSGTSLDVTWAAPSNTGPAITSYDLQYRQGTSGELHHRPARDRHQRRHRGPDAEHVVSGTGARHQRRRRRRLVVFGDRADRRLRPTRRRWRWWWRDSPSRGRWWRWYGEQFPDGGCGPGPERRVGRCPGDAGRQRQQPSGRRAAAISLESNQWRARGAVVPEYSQSHLHGPGGADS